MHLQEVNQAALRLPMLFRQNPTAMTGSDIEAEVKNEDEWWQRNWDKHRTAPIKNLWRTVLRLNF
ncbi:MULTISPECIES: hypothetical protein [unclassified Pseudomonas]|uniref:hypothetical protein n=1 Tax=unclassified Pseudomonas TaxID=196821 RepID=UPI001587C2AE|nr:MULTISPECIES: hypothetical protein [unclassified Pseudomonas]